MLHGTCRGDHEVCRIDRKVLIETLKGELPEDTIRYSSKLVHIEESGYFKLVHLADGTVIKTKVTDPTEEVGEVFDDVIFLQFIEIFHIILHKVLIGCDGVNSKVAKYLGLKKPSLAGRASIRGHVEFEDGHGFEPKFLQFFGNGARYGVTPCDDHGVYWFFTYIPSTAGSHLSWFTNI